MVSQSRPVNLVSQSVSEGIAAYRCVINVRINLRM